MARLEAMRSTNVLSTALALIVYTDPAILCLTAPTTTSLFRRSQDIANLDDAAQSLVFGRDVYVATVHFPQIIPRSEL